MQNNSTNSALCKHNPQNNSNTMVEQLKWLYEETCKQNQELAEQVGRLKRELFFYKGIEPRQTKLQTKVIALNQTSSS